MAATSRPGRGKGRRCVPYGPVTAKQGHEARADVVVVAHVLVLLLAPHQLRAWVPLGLLLDQIKGERGDLRGQSRNKLEQGGGWGGGSAFLAPPRTQGPEPACTLAGPPLACPGPGHAVQDQSGLGTMSLGLYVTLIVRAPAVHLLQAREGHLLLQAPAAALLDQVVVHLSCAEDEPPHLPRSPRCSPTFRNHPLEAGPWGGGSRQGWCDTAQRGHWYHLPTRSPQQAFQGSSWPPGPIQCQVQAMAIAWHLLRLRRHREGRGMGWQRDHVKTPPLAENLPCQLRPRAAVSGGCDTPLTPVALAHVSVPCRVFHS